MIDTTMIDTTPIRRTRRCARYAALLSVPLLIGILAACSSGSPKEAKKPAAPEQTLQDWQVSFSACMRDEGIVDFPDPEADGSIRGSAVGGDEATALEASSTTCMEKLGEPPAGPGGKKTDQEQLEQGIKTAKCLRDNGFDVPDPKEGQLLAIDSVVPQEIMAKCIGEDGMTGSTN